MKNNKLTNCLCAVSFLLSVLLFVGSFTFFKTCGPMEDGGWMTCHWAGESIKAISGVMVCISLLALVIKNIGAKLGLNISNILISAICALMPGTIINTCMMKDMQCNSVTKPFTVLICVAIGIAALANVLINIKQVKKDIK